jgi:hypothetical protein
MPGAIPQIGAIGALAREEGIPTPAIDALMRLFHDVEDGRRPQSIETLDELLKAAAPELTPARRRHNLSWLSQNEASYVKTRFNRDACRPDLREFCSCTSRSSEELKGPWAAVGSAQRSAPRQ